MIEALLLNLENHDVVSIEETNLLRSMIVRQMRFNTGDDLVTEGSRPDYSTLMLEGFAARYKLMPDGSRQITAIHVAGDFVDLHAFLLKKMDHGIVALTPCRTAPVAHAHLTLITESQPHITRLFWLSTLVDGAIHREWIVAMGRRSKKAHLAHLICELFARLQVVKKTDGNSFKFPLSQAEMADVLGISVVHLNKTLQTLRKSQTVIWENREISILDWDGLAAIAGFDPTYLSFSIEPR